jgi:hypothetical protein
MNSPELMYFHWLQWDNHKYSIHCVCLGVIYTFPGSKWSVMNIHFSVSFSHSYELSFYRTLYVKCNICCNGQNVISVLSDAIIFMNKQGLFEIVQGKWTVRWCLLLQMVWDVVQQSINWPLRWWVFDVVGGLVLRTILCLAFLISVPFMFIL